MTKLDTHAQYTNAETMEEANLVIVEYEDLVNNTDSVKSSSSVEDQSRRLMIQKALHDAYVAPDSCGLLAIRNVPDFVSSKVALLSQSHALAHLPPKSLQALEDAESLYNAGWSHGKEQLGNGGVDLNKASFYYNPLTDQPGTVDDRTKYPLSYPSNRWPACNEIPNFEENAKQLGKILLDVTLLVAKNLDYVSLGANTATNNVSLYNALKDTDKVKSRLLYYYPPADNKQTATSVHSNDVKLDSWIGWHNDSGFLTALAGDMYFDHTSGHVLDFPQDKTAGLYISNRQGCVQHVTVPSDCCAVQMGEATQIITGGAVSATPHCVKAATSKNIARTSLACFVDTRPDFVLQVPPGHTRNDVLQASVIQTGIPPLKERWTSTEQTFGDFLHITFSLYYQHATKHHQATKI